MPRPLVIVTGFGAFAEVRNNPAELLLRELEGEGLGDSIDARFELFDTAYRSVSRRLPELLAQRPDALAMIGFSRRATALTLERRATSRKSAEHADEFGFLPQADEPANEIGHQRMDNAAIDFAALAARLEADGIPTKLSDDAGAYVCNHCYFEALAAIRRDALATRALFVHIPAIAGMADRPEAAGELALDTLAEGLRAVARQLAG